MARKSNPWSGEQGGGRGRGGRNGQPGQGQPPPQQTGGGPAGGGGRTPGEGTRGGGPPRPSFMGMQAHNPDPHPKVKAILEAVKGKGANPRTMMRAAGKKGHELKKLARTKGGRPHPLPRMGVRCMRSGRMQFVARQCEHTSGIGGLAVHGSPTRGGAHKKQQPKLDPPPNQVPVPRRRWGRGWTRTPGVG